MNFFIKQCVAFGGGFTTSEDWRAYAHGNKQLSLSQELPKLAQIPAMQRRRLSPFAKITLHCALEAAGLFSSTVPSVFSSRHGDLAKTSQLIADVAAKEPLSPTQFGLSVHNAVGGLFSIYAGNKSPLTAISSGEDSFFIGLLDALAKLNANDYQQILFVYSENIVPTIYQPYIKQEEVAIACALLIEKMPEESVKGDKYSLTMQANVGEQQENSRLQVLDFLSFYYSNSASLDVCSKRHLWQLAKK